MNSPAVSVSAVRVVSHPNYSTATLNNDISVIQLSGSIGLGPSIQVIRLPTRSQQSTTFNGLQARVSGFGLTQQGGQVSNTLNWINARVILNSECASIYGSSVVIASTICAHGWDHTQQSTCNGDSGGPLVLSEGGIWTQIGVVSFVSGNGCAFGHPHGYVRTSHFVDWINSVTGIAVRP